MQQQASIGQMHEGQWHVAAEAVERLVGQQFSQWRELPISPVLSHGTVNALFRLGDRMVVRFDLFPSADPRRRAELVAAQENVIRLARQVTVQVPVPLAVGEPGEGYPGYWTVYEWIPGRTVQAPPASRAAQTAPASRAAQTSHAGEIRDLEAFALDLAGFITELRDMPTDGRAWDGMTRGGPQTVHDAQVRACIADSAALVDSSRLAAIWDECLDAATSGQDDVWIHADLMPGNLLVHDGRLAAVIDCEGLCLGDPAVDLMPAWNLLPAGPPRDTFRRALAVEDATWARGRGWALCQAIVALPYYVDTNKVMADTAVHTLAALLD